MYCKTGLVFITQWFHPAPVANELSNATLRVGELIKGIDISKRQACAYEQYWCLGLFFLNTAMRVQLEKATSMNKFCEKEFRGRSIRRKLQPRLWPQCCVLSISVQS